jgi:hypothetical protein
MVFLAYLFEGGEARQVRLRPPIGEISRLSTEADSNNVILDGACSLHCALDSSPHGYGGQCAASCLERQGSMRAYSRVSGSWLLEPNAGLRRDPREWNRRRSMDLRRLSGSGARIRT